MNIFRRAALGLAAFVLTLAPMTQSDAATVHIKMPWVQRVGSDGCFTKSYHYTEPHLLFKGYDGLFYVTTTTTLQSHTGKITYQRTVVTAHLTKPHQSFPTRFSSSLGHGWHQTSLTSAEKIFKPRPYAKTCP